MSQSLAKDIGITFLAVIVIFGFKYILAIAILLFCLFLYWLFTLLF